MSNLSNTLLCSIMILQATTGWATEDDPCGRNLKMLKRIERGEVRLTQATETLTAQNIIASDAKADYQAGNSITLMPGFSAEAGATFLAQVKSCDCNELNALNPEADQMTLSAYPNPFVESTVIRYQLKQASPVYLSIVNEQGKVLDVLVDNRSQEAGVHGYTYRNTSLPGSMYLYSLRTNEGVITKRLLKGN